MKKVILSGLLATLGTVHASEVESKLAIALTSNALAAKIQELNKTKATRDYRGWGGFEFVSAAATETAFSGTDCDSVQFNRFELTYKNDYGAQVAQMEASVKTVTKHCKSGKASVEVTVLGVEENQGSLNK